MSPLRAGPAAGRLRSGGNGSSSRPALLPPGQGLGSPAGKAEPATSSPPLPPPTPPPRLPTSAPAPLPHRLRRCPSAAAAAARPPPFLLPPSPPPRPQRRRRCFHKMAGTVAERDAPVSGCCAPSPGLRAGAGAGVAGRAAQDPAGTCERGAGAAPAAPASASALYLQKIEDGHLNNSLGSPVQADVYFPRLVNHLFLGFWAAVCLFAYSFFFKSSPPSLRLLN